MGTDCAACSGRPSLPRHGVMWCIHNSNLHHPLTDLYLNHLFWFWVDLTIWASKVIRQSLRWSILQFLKIRVKTISVRNSKGSWPTQLPCNKHIFCHSNSDVNTICANLSNKLGASSEHNLHADEIFANNKKSKVPRHDSGKLLISRLWN